MHREQKEKICKSFRWEEFFLPSTIERFLKESCYRNKQTLVEAMKYPRLVYRHLTAQGDDYSKQRKRAFRELCLTELKELISLPEVASDENLNRYAHMILGLYDGSCVSNRFKLENMANKLEIKLLHSITNDDTIKLKSFLKIICMYSNKLLIYSPEDNKALDKLCSMV